MVEDSKRMKVFSLETPLQDKLKIIAYIKISIKIKAVVLAWIQTKKISGRLIQCG